MKSYFFNTALGVAGAAMLLTLAAARADAGLIASAPNITVAPGATGTFDVTLTNTGSSTVYIGGFEFGLSTTNPDILFTDATVNTVTAPYIFASDSVFGPDILLSTSPFIADDNGSNASGDPVAAGATVGLGNVSYMVSNASPFGSVTITLTAYPTTALADAYGNNIPITTLTNGSIDVATPEPASILLTLGGLAAFAGFASRGRFLRI
jgi:hypothetical protein